MNATTAPQGRRIIWLNVLTVFSAAILIGAEVFGGAFAAGWAFANLFHLEGYAVHILQGVFFLLGVAVMVRFVVNAAASSLSPRADGVCAATPSALASADLPFAKIFLRLAHYILCSRGLLHEQKC